MTWAETRALAGALLASVAWARRAVETEDPTILQRLYAAPDRDVAAEQLIAEARAGGGRLRYVEPPRVTQLVLLTVTPEQQARMAGSGIGSTSLAWAVTTQGPVILAVTWPGAPERLYTVVPADHQMTEVSVGAAVTDARLGVVWAERYSQDCTVLPDPVMCVV